MQASDPSRAIIPLGTAPFHHPWLPVAAWPQRQLHSVGHWLLDTESLTRRLQSGGAEFSVQRRSQVWSFPTFSERSALKVPQRQAALIREVVLMADARPVVFARSVFPCTTLSGNLRWLRHLQNRSLGSILFTNPWLQRSPFELARLPGDTPLLPEDLQQQPSAWGRRSVFLIDQRPLLVAEIFLESFRPWCSSRSVQRSRRRWSGAQARGVTATHRHKDPAQAPLHQ